jgi:hypothetical protein
MVSGSQRLLIGDPLKIPNSSKMGYNLLKATGNDNIFGIQPFANVSCQFFFIRVVGIDKIFNKRQKSKCFDSQI